MAAKSEKQQQLFGVARAVQKGEIPASKAGPAARRIARTVEVKEVRKFAATPHKDVPVRVSSRRKF